MIRREHNMTFCIASSLFFAFGEECQKTERPRYLRGESRVRAAKPRLRGRGKVSLPALEHATRPSNIVLAQFFCFFVCLFVFFFLRSSPRIFEQKRDCSLLTERYFGWNLYSQDHFFKTLNKRHNVTSRTSTPRMPPQDTKLFPHRGWL